ncbi:MAG: hypothetical protein WBJ50_09305, partial [Smithellaceae bacterium]
IFKGGRKKRDRPDRYHPMPASIGFCVSPLDFLPGQLSERWRKLNGKYIQHGFRRAKFYN